MKKLLIYSAVSFGLAWGICLILYLSGGWMMAATLSTGLAACMLCPALGVLAVKLLTRESWAGLGLKPHFRGHMRHYLAAWCLPVLGCVLGAALWFAIHPDRFSTETLTASGLTPVYLVFALLFAPFLNLIPAAGEELGWRSWLLPHLKERCGVGRAVLWSGLIWGLWHGPMIALGHNYGLSYPGYPWTGVAMFCLICVGLGAFLSWLRLKTGSFWPAALAHGFFNGAAGTSLLFLRPGAAYSAFTGPLATGVVGCCFILLWGLWCWRDLCRGNNVNQDIS